MSSLLLCQITLNIIDDLPSTTDRSLSGLINVSSSDACGAGVGSLTVILVVCSVDPFEFVKTIVYFPLFDEFNS